MKPVVVIQLILSMLLFVQVLKANNHQLEVTNNQESTDFTFNNVIQLLKEGDQKIKLTEEHKDVVLVLGNSGTGKSTIALLLSGSELESVKKGNDFLVKDKNEKICLKSTIDSCTAFPDLLIDKKTGTAFYDCPGFKDSRGTNLEIAITYSIKKVIDHIKSVKLIFIVNHASLIQGIYRDQFIFLLKQVTNLVKNIEKYKNSFFLIANKVGFMPDEDKCNNDGFCPPLPDDKIISGIGSFLETVKQSLEEKIKSLKDFSEQKVLYENQIKFINILLEKENQNYTRIGIFRIPLKSGSINNITTLQNEKEYLENILHKKLKFTKINHDDFGYTISDQAKNDIYYMMEKINDNIWANIEKIADKVNLFYNSLIEKMLNKIQSFAISSEIIHVNQSEAREFLKKLYEGNDITKKLIGDIKNITTDNLADKINNSIMSLNIDGCEDYILGISNQGRYFRFLKNISGNVIGTKQWDVLFMSVLKSISNLNKELRREIDNVREKLRNMIDSYINSIAENTEELFRKKSDILEIQKLLPDLSSGYFAMLNLTQEISYLSTPQALSKKIDDTFEKLDINEFKTRRRTFTVLKMGDYLDFLKIIRGTELQLSSSTWIIPFNTTTKYLYESHIFYNFLNDLYGKLSRYDIQRNKAIYDIGSITKDKFKQFLKMEKIKKLNLTDHNAVVNFEVSDFKLQKLNKILDRTLRHNVDTSCQSTTLVVKGNYVKFSDFVDIRGRLRDLCQNVKSVNIFALNTLFIDTDFDAVGKTLSVYFIAPKWEIIGRRKINLSGFDGEIHTQTYAHNATNPSENGTDGKPGFPGGSSGSFFGIGAEFVNGNLLQINADGGSGGPGQHGGNGFPGKDGNKTPNEYDGYYRNYYYCNCFLPSRGDLDGFSFSASCTRAKVKKPYRNPIYGEEEKCVAYIVQSASKVPDLNVNCDVYIYGESGGSGSNGGNGGKGGVKGQSGSIRIIALHKSSDISTSNIDGKPGKMGKGGTGGAGGKGAKVLHLYCESAGPIFLSHPFTEKWTLKESFYNPNKPSGKNGTDGGNALESSVPKEAAAIQNLSRIINSYKFYLRENINDKIMKIPLHQFLNGLDNNDDVENDELGYADELYGLEEQFHELVKNKGNLILLYQSLLDRILRYAKGIGNNKQRKLLLTYLYAAALSKIYDLKTDFDSIFITDLREYLRYGKNNVEELNNLEEKIKKVEIINQLKENYKVNIDNKIKEAMIFIDDKLNPEMDRIQKKLDNKIQDLIAEVGKIKENTLKEQEKFKEIQKKLEKTLVIRKVFTLLSITGEVVKYLGPKGKVVGEIVGTGISIAEPFVLNDQTNPEKAATLPPSITANINLPEYHLSSKSKRSFLFLSTEEDISKKRLKRNAKVEQIMNRIEQARDFSNVFNDLYSKYKKDRNNLDAVNDAIKQSEKNYKNMKFYEDKIISRLKPMLENVAKALNDKKSTFVMKSHVALDVSKWKIQSSLKEVKTLIRQFTKGFKVEDELALYIEMLEEVITTLINIYDRIEDYQSQQNFATYIAAISTVSYSTDKWDGIQDKLEIIIKSNIILKQYEMVINALKQWAFPFADRFLDKITLPNDLKLNINNITDLVFDVKKQINTAIARLDNYKTSIWNIDTYKISGTFNSNDESSHPFYYWKNDKYKDIITKLLSGEEIVVKADVTCSNPNKDAIKFKLIDINFKSNNAKIQEEINKTLKSFKVIATHMGNSYYRFNDKFYLIISESKQFRFTFEKNLDGTPKHLNEEYKKVKDGDIILSPYAMWKFQIIKNTNGASFADLIKHKDEVDMELIGEGSYVEKGVDTSNLNVDDFYKSDNTLIDNGICDQYLYK